MKSSMIRASTIGREIGRLIENNRGNDTLVPYRELRDIAHKLHPDCTASAEHFVQTAMESPEALLSPLHEIMEREAA